jgi:hypothetical protein
VHSSAAQDVSLWLDASTSHAQPPAGATADAAQYILLGGRLATDFDWGSLSFAGRYGGAFQADVGRWLQGEASVSTGGRAGAAWVRASAAAFGLRYVDPFRYDASGFQLRPSVSVPAGSYVISAVPDLTFGSWSTDGRGTNLRNLGGDIELRRAFGAVGTVLSGGALRVENGVTAGTFARASGAVTLDRGRWATQLQLRVQRTPLENEIGGGLHLSVAAAPGLELHAHMGQTIRDPRYGTPGAVGVSLRATVRAVHWSPPPPPAVASLAERSDSGQVVRFAIRAPEAASVQLTGAFTGWEPVAMEPAPDGWWRLSRVLAPGLHHFGFLVDGEWAIPEGAPGVVDDGWGRRNASIVVDP